jgi:hypothetical protein
MFLQIIDTQVSYSLMLYNTENHYMNIHLREKQLCKIIVFLR